MSTLIKNVMNPGKYNNYLIGGNLCNAFALGEIGSLDDFFIVGAEPDDESNYPLITANILDSEGETLFRLVKNVLVFNPGHCSKILGDHIGYEIHDSAGNLIFRVSTRFERTEQLPEECYVTTIEANFFDKASKLVFHAKSGGEDEKIESFCKSAFGFSGGFGMVMGYNQDEIELVRLALLTKGSVNQRLTGEHNHEQIELEGRIVQNANLKNCEITIRDGNFIIGPNNSFEACKFNFVEKAGQIYNLVKMLSNQKAK
jgi:hypothetical protein